MSDEISFEGPPPPGQKHRRDWSKVAAILKARPNEWAIVSRSAQRNVTTAINSGVYKDFRPTEYWEAVSRKNETTGEILTYVRYIGPAEEEEQP